MSADHKLSAEEIALFQAAVSDVKPLPQDKVAPPLPEPPRTRQRQNKPTITAAKEKSAEKSNDLFFSDQFEPPTAEGPLSFAQSGVSPQVRRQLKRGEFPRQAELDLHGLTVAQARETLTQFLYQCKAKKFRCVIIIHGKGHRSTGNPAVLKSRVNHWLPHWNQTLAFCSALPTEGGTGALYLLLKPP